MKKKIVIIVMIFLVIFMTGGSVIMADYNIQMGQRNSANTDWDKHYPITRAENVLTPTGNVLIDINNKVDKSPGMDLSDNNYSNEDKAEVAKVKNKADKTYVDTLSASIASGSPKGIYPTVTALTTAYPSGNTNIYVVTADGNWYYWDSTMWKPGGVYQSTGIAENSVTPTKTSFFKFSKNLFNKDTAMPGYAVNETDGSIYANASYCASDFISVEPSTQYTEKYSYYIAWYNSDKSYISGLSATGATPRTITSPSNAKYIRVSVAIAIYSTYQIEKGTTSTEFEDFYEYLDNKYVNISDGSLDVKKTNFATLGKNLFDKSAATIGYVVNEATGATYANPNYGVSDFIEIEQSTQYTESTGLYQAYYDTNKVFISGLGVASTPSLPRTFTTPSNAKYIRTSFDPVKITAYQLEKGTEPTTYEPYGFKFTKQIPVQKDATTELLLPLKIYALVGQELNIYFDNIMNDKDTKYDFNVECLIGEQHDNYYRVTPVAAGTYGITINAYQDNIERATVTSNIIVSAVNAGSTANKKVLIIGDSTTADALLTQKLLENFGASDVMDITLMGTQGTSPYLHEGRIGWTANQYFTDSASPFVFSGVFDFTQYIGTNSLTSPDYVIINLGINDTFGYTDDASLKTKIATMLTQYQGMVNSIHSYNANIKIGLAITIPPAYDQNSFGKAYGCGQTRWRYKRNNFLWTKALINKFSGQESSHIYLVPINTNLDTRHNMGLETISVNARNTTVTETSIIANGNVHPVESGYWQIADVYWYWIKSFEN